MNVFVVNVPMHYYLFRSIAEHLEDSAYIIPPLADIRMSDKYGGGMSAKGQYDYLYSVLSRNGERVVDYGERNRSQFISYVTRDVNNVICPHWFDGIYEIDGVRIFKIVYGMPNNEAKDQLSYAQNYICDAILTYGSESVERYSQRGMMAESIGNPLFDRWFKNDINGYYLDQTRKMLDGTKKTILYLPTHNYYSSIDRYAEDLFALADKYNVITKLHHMTFNGEVNRVCNFLSHPEIITLGDYFDPLPLYKVADVVLTDVSGALFDAILIDKPVVMLGNSFRRYKIDVLATQGESHVGETGKILYAEDPQEVEGKIDEAMNKPLVLDDVLKQKLFHYRDGNVGMRAAEIIMDEKRYPMVPTIEKYERGIRNAPNEEFGREIRDKKDYFVKRYTCKSGRAKNTIVPCRYKNLLKKIVRAFLPINN